MDATTAERINNLAKNLKDLHLASSLEDAFSKAREIILGTQGSGKPISQMTVEEEAVNELSDTKNVEVAQKEEITQAKNIQETVSEVREAQVKVELNNAELAEETAKVSEQLKKHYAELAKIKSEIEQAKAALEEAKRVKESFSRQIPDMTFVPRPQDSSGFSQAQMAPMQQTPVQQKPRSSLSEDDKKKSDLSKIFNFGKR